MAALTLDEEFFLLTRDEESGKDQTYVGVDAPLAGAVLIELAAAGAIEIDADEHVLVRPGAQLQREHHLLVVQAIEAERKPRKPSHWLTWLPGKLDLQERIGVSLVEQGILRDDRSKILGITVKRFPEIDPGPEQRIRAELAQALTGAEHHASPRTKILGGLLSAVGRIKHVVDKPHRKDAEKRAKEWAKETPVNDAVSKSIQATQTAIMTAAFVPVFIATTSN